MKLIFCRLSKEVYITRHSTPHHFRHVRLASFDATAVKFVRDRGLDHAVERERNLRPLINLKNLLKLEPSKSLPISVISQQRYSLQIPIRPIEFVRRYPSVFEEFTPGSIAVHPHVKLKDEVLELDADEQLIYQSDSYRKDVADRLLKLLMISRVNEFPLTVLDSLMWDMGLPRDFVQSIVPDFPDYFRVVGSGDSRSDSHGRNKVGVLELVCWSNEHAVPAVEKKGTPAVFPMNFSKGFEIDKKYKKWLDEWQRLPYLSPYEDGSHLGPLTDESDKWAASVLHELLNLFVSKKTEKDIVLYVGEYLGIRSRFKRALLNHPGMFYLSNKIGTYTVVLKEAFKRGSLVEEHPMMVMRNRYIHLMNTVKEEKVAAGAPGSSHKKQDQKASGQKDGLEDEEEEEEEEQEGREDGEGNMSSSEFEDEDDVEYDEDAKQRGAGRKNTDQGRDSSKMRGRSINPMKRIGRRQVNGREKRASTRFSEGQDLPKAGKFQTRWSERSDVSSARTARKGISRWPERSDVSSARSARKGLSRWPERSDVSSDRSARKGLSRWSERSNVSSARSASRRGLSSS